MVSLVAKPDTGTVSDAEVAGSVKVPTIGAVTSIITVAVRAAETLPAASFAQA